MGLEVKLALNELCKEVLKVCHSSDSVGVETGVGGRSLFNWLETRGPECVAASEREVWQGRDRKGMVEAEEDLDFKVAGKVTVGGNGGSKLVFLFDGCLPSEVFFAGDRARTVDNRQVLLLRFNKVAGKLVWYGGNSKG